MSVVESGIENKSRRSPLTKPRRSVDSIAILTRYLVQIGDQEENRIAWAYAGRLILFALAFLLADRLSTLFTSDLAASFGLPDAVLLCGLLLSRPAEWWRYLL